MFLGEQLVTCKVTTKREARQPKEPTYVAGHSSAPYCSDPLANFKPYPSGGACSLFLGVSYPSY